MTHINQNTKFTENNRKVLKAATVKGQVLNKGRPITATLDFSTEIWRTEGAELMFNKLQEATDASSNY